MSPKQCVLSPTLQTLHKAGQPCGQSALSAKICLSKDLIRLLKKITGTWLPRANGWARAAGRLPKMGIRWDRMGQDGTGEHVKVLSAKSHGEKNSAGARALLHILLILHMGIPAAWSLAITFGFCKSSQQTLQILFPAGSVMIPSCLASVFPGLVQFHSSHCCGPLGQAWQAHQGLRTQEARTRALPGAGAPSSMSCMYYVLCKVTRARICK